MGRKGVSLIRPGAQKASRQLLERGRAGRVISGGATVATGDPGVAVRLLIAEAPGREGGAEGTEGLMDAALKGRIHGLKITTGTVQKVN